MIETAAIEIALYRYRSHIDEALERFGNTHAFEDIVEGIVTGDMQLWMTPNSITITEIHIFPRCKAIHVFLACGDMQEILLQHERIIAWAKQMGCDRATQWGRAGWRRVLDKLGWRPSMQAMVLPFNGTPDDNRTTTQQRLV
jgi:hypothetical protein